MAAEALHAASALDDLSFYGLSHWLAEVSKLLDRIDEASLAKAPSAEDLKLTEQKDELLEAQSRLRRTMGALLESPSLTKRERPLAEEFLRQQISKLEKGAAAAAGSAKEKALRAIEKLRFLQLEVSQKKASIETREVQEIQASLVDAEAEWKEVAPIYEKWEKGKHSFKTNADLQAMTRRYNDAKKIRETAPDRLQKALRSSREGKALAVPVKESGPPKGWFYASGKAPPASRPGGTRAPPRRPAGPSAWGSSMISFAQRLRAEQVAQVRKEAEEGDEPGDDEEDDEDADVNAAAPPSEAYRQPPVVRPKAAPPLAPPKAAPPLKSDDGFAPVKAAGRFRPAPAPVARQTVEDEDGEDEEAEEVSGPSRPAASNAKKKGKVGKKKKSGGREDDDVLENASTPAQRIAKPSTAAWAAAAEVIFSGSVLQELLQAAAWSLPQDEAIADSMLERLAERLPWASPLGLTLPLEWKDFVSLEVDGGPQRTSKRGTSPGVHRVEQNIASLLAHYVTLIFFANLFHALSHFGLMFCAALMQVGFILSPPGTIRSPARVLLLQAAHMLLWLLFMRSLYQMHFFVKCFAVILVGIHAYAVVPLRKED